MLRSPSLLVRGGETCDYLCRSLCVVRRCDHRFFLPRKRREEKKNQQFFKRKGSQNPLKSLSSNFSTLPSSGKIGSVRHNKRLSIKTHTYNKKELSIISRSNKMMMMCVRCCVIHFSTFRYHYCVLLLLMLLL